MTRLSQLAFGLIMMTALLAAACGGGDDGDSDEGNQPTDTPGDDATAAATNAPADNSSTANGGGGDDEFFQINGTGVLTLVVDGDTYEFDVTCEVDKGMTFSDEPIWDYVMESADPEVVVQSTYQVVDGEETFKNLSVIGAGLTISALEFQDVTSGGTEWAGTFISAGIAGGVEGTFETSCS